MWGEQWVRATSGSLGGRDGQYSRGRSWERCEGAPGLAGVVEGAEAEVKGPPSWPGLSHIHLGSWGPWSLQGDCLLGEPWPDPAVATCWPRGLYELRQVGCWVPTRLPLCSHCQTGSPAWLLTDGPSSEQGRQPLRPHFTELLPQERAALSREESRGVGGAASQMCL